MHILLLFKSIFPPFISVHKHFFPADKHIVFSAHWLVMCLEHRGIKFLEPLMTRKKVSYKWPGISLHLVNLNLENY